MCPHLSDVLFSPNISSLSLQCNYSCNTLGGGRTKDLGGCLPVYHRHDCASPHTGWACQTGLWTLLLILLDLRTSLSLMTYGNPHIHSGPLSFAYKAHSLPLLFLILNPGPMLHLGKLRLRAALTRSSCNSLRARLTPNSHSVLRL